MTERSYETVDAEDIAELFDVDRVSVYRFTNLPGFPFPEDNSWAGATWFKDEVEEWLSQNSEEVEVERQQRKHEIEAAEKEAWEQENALRIWKRPWSELEWWQKPIQGLYAGVLGGILAIGTVVVLLVGGALVLVYLYHLLTNTSP